MLVVKPHGVAWLPFAHEALGGKLYKLQGLIFHKPDHCMAHVKIADGTIYECKDRINTALAEVHFLDGCWCYVQDVNVANVGAVNALLDAPQPQ